MKDVKILCLIILLIPLLSGDCNKDVNGYDLRFKVKNNSNGVISIFQNSLDYPDTTLFETRPFLEANDYYFIMSGKSRSFYLTGSTWEKEFNKASNGIIMVYLINTDTLKKFDWDSIRINYKILQRYDLSLKDLQNRNWEIEYPYDSTRGKLKVWKK